MPMNRRNVIFISLSQFGMNFSFNFVLVFLPFFIHRVSPYSPQQTLLWVGLIMGSSSFVAAVASTGWGSLAARHSPKKLYINGLISHAVLILATAFVSNLPLLFAIRIVQGILGGVSTLGLIIVSASSSRESTAKDIGFFQNAMTLGQLIGPPLGALSASMLGYKGAFISASALVFVTIAFCFLFVDDVEPKAEPPGASRKPTLNRKSLIAWSLVFTVNVQLMFLPGILPNVFEGFGIAHDIALRWSGVVVMLYTATAMMGTYLLTRLSAGMSTVRLIVYIGIAGIILQALMAACPGLMSLVATRVVQTFVIGAVLPLTISLFASDLNGKIIGFLNAGRFAGNALAPMIGTWVLAFSGLNSVYLFISGISLLAMAGFAMSFGGRGGSRIETGTRVEAGSPPAA